MSELESLSPGGADRKLDAKYLKQSLANLVQEAEAKWLHFSASRPPRARDTSGACLTAALVAESCLAVGNGKFSFSTQIMCIQLSRTLTPILVTEIVYAVGDSKAVFVRGDGTIEQLTYDHRSDNPAEKTRIIRAGGYVTRGYVFGMLQPSRSIGDYDVKSVKGNSKYPVLSWKPFVSSVALEEDDMATLKETRAAQVAPVQMKRRGRGRRLAKHRSSSDVVHFRATCKELGSSLQVPELSESTRRAADTKASKDGTSEETDNLAARFGSVSVGKSNVSPPKESGPVSAGTTVKASFFTEDNEKGFSAPSETAVEAPYDTGETMRKNCRFSIPPICALIMATDGVWDFMSVDHVVATVANEIHATGSAQQAASALADEAVANESTDDVTVSITWFRPEK